mgnify:CR=1 FL=1
MEQSPAGAFHYLRGAGLIATFGSDLGGNAFGFFGDLSTGAGILAWLRRHPPGLLPWPHRIALAAYAGDPTLAQEWLDTVVVEASSGSDWYGNSLLRTAARLAGRLGLACPAPADLLPEAERPRNGRRQ